MGRHYTEGLTIMAYQVPKSKASIKQNRFEFEVDGKTYDIPQMKYLSIGSVEAFENEHPIQGLIMASDNEDARAALRSLEGDQLEGLMEAWQKESGVSVGESEASGKS